MANGRTTAKAAAIMAKNGEGKSEFSARWMGEGGLSAIPSCFTGFAGVEILLLHCRAPKKMFTPPPAGPGQERLLPNRDKWAIGEVKARLEACTTRRAGKNLP